MLSYKTCYMRTIICGHYKEITKQLFFIKRKPVKAFDHLILSYYNWCWQILINLMYPVDTCLWVCYSTPDVNVIKELFKRISHTCNIFRSGWSLQEGQFVRRTHCSSAGHSCRGGMMTRQIPGIPTQVRSCSCTTV